MRNVGVSIILSELLFPMEMIEFLFWRLENLK